MRYLIVALIAAALAACVPSKAGGPEGPLASLLRIDLRAGEAVGHGSGIAISPDRVLTAKHVTTVAVDNVTIVEANGASQRGYQVWQSILEDASIISLKEPLTGPITPYTCALPKVGDKLMAAGWGMEFPPVQVPHTVVGYTAEGDILSAGPLLKGMSGGPVFNADGEVVAIGVATLQAVAGPAGVTETGFSRFVPLHKICDKLSQAVEVQGADLHITER